MRAINSKTNGTSSKITAPRLETEKSKFDFDAEKRNNIQKLQQGDPECKDRIALLEQKKDSVTDQICYDYC